MALELVLQAGSITPDGASVLIQDNTDWTASPYPRSSYGVFVSAKYHLSETPEEVTLIAASPFTATSWTAITMKNGRYLFTAAAFLLKGVEAPTVGDVNVDETDGLLYEWDGTYWELVELTDVLAKAEDTSVLDVPLLSYAYAYKNTLNLAYIAQVKNDIEKGGDQNKLYYKRTNLDYFSALILGAEYNWAIGSYSYFYQIVANINVVIATGKII